MQVRGRKGEWKLQVWVKQAGEQRWSELSPCPTMPEQLPSGVAGTGPQRMRLVCNICKNGQAA